MSALVGLIPTNDVRDFARQKAWLGKAPGLTTFFLDHRSAPYLSGFQGLIDTYALPFYRAGAQRMAWRVGVPGPGMLEAVAYGTFDSLYQRIAAYLAKLTSDNNDALVRVAPPWEQNISGGFDAQKNPIGQYNTARDVLGAWSAPLAVKAWERIAKTFLSEIGKDRCYNIWNPNVGENGNVSPRDLMPDPLLFRCIGQDTYMSAGWGHTPGVIFPYWRDHDVGLNWGYETAQTLKKDYALPEWGVDDDSLLGDMQGMVDWIKARNLHHHSWWDRVEAPDCRISSGVPNKAKIAAAHKAAFA